MVDKLDTFAIVVSTVNNESVIVQSLLAFENIKQITFFSGSCMMGLYKTFNKLANLAAPLE